ncbi:MAG: hypothetical protein ABMA64_37135, partial [Myxococcota bacterium]
MTLTSLLDAALADCPDPTLLAPAQRVIEAPWTTVVFGRVGVGKTSLVNRHAGAGLPVGLGGVTRAARRVDGWVDTPGIDDPSRAIVELAEWLDLADAAVWVTDGLQPMTRSERDVAGATLHPGTPLWVVVSRADLIDPSELPAVVQRVAALAAPHQPVDVVAADLRRGAPTVGQVERIGRFDPPGPRRLARVAVAAQAARASLPPAPLDPASVVDRWRAAVREAARGVEARIAGGELTHPVDAEAALVAVGRDVVSGLEAAAGGALRLPQPPAPTPR